MKTWQEFLPQAQAIVSRYRADAPAGYDPANFEGWGAAIALTAAAVGAGATVYASSQASDSAKAANQQNATNVSNTNDLNYQQFLQSRGSTGSAVLPIYAAPAEQQLYTDTLNAYNASGGANTPTLGAYENVVGQSLPAAQLATQAANGIFNGQTVGQELNNQQPVAAANLTLAQTQKQSSLEALQQTLNNIKSIQAGKGYAGDSYTNQLLNFQARQAANTQGAQAIAEADLGNAQQTQAIQQNAINRQLSNLGLPSSTAQQQINLLQAPTNALNQNQVNRQNLFANFKIGVGQPFQYQPPPLTTPVAGTGQQVAQGIGSLVNGVGNYAANQQLINALNPATTAATTNTSAFSNWNLINSSNLGAAAPDIWSNAATSSIPVGDFGTGADFSGFA